MLALPLIFAFDRAPSPKPALPATEGGVEVMILHNAPKPDFILTEVNIGPLKVNNMFCPCTYVFKNQGAATADLKDVKIDAFWSTDGTLKPGTPPLIKANFTRAYQGNVVLTNQSIRIHSGAKHGGNFDASIDDDGLKKYRYLVVIIDSGRNIAESNENNNNYKQAFNPNIRDHRTD